MQARVSTLEGELLVSCSDAILSNKLAAEFREQLAAMNSSAGASTSTGDLLA